MNQLSVKARLTVFLSICLIFIGCSTYLLITSFSKNPLPKPFVTTINKPQHSARSGDENIKASAIITKVEYGRIQRFKGYMDSLVRSPAGRKVYDSIVAIRPGLMDSILFVENIYQSQTKK